jgi:hypothetical protein
MYPSGIILGVLGLVVAGASPAPVPVRIFGLICIPLAWWFGTIGGRIGVDINEADILVRGLFGSERLSRADIVGVGTHRWFLNFVVHFDLRHGRRLSTNLIQSARVSWKDGRTNDILSVLQGEIGIRVVGTASAPPSSGADSTRL